MDGSFGHLVKLLTTHGTRGAPLRPQMQAVKVEPVAAAHMACRGGRGDGLETDGAFHLLGWRVSRFGAGAVVLLVLLSLLLLLLFERVWVAMMMLMKTT